MKDAELRLIYDEAARNRFAKFMEDENMPPPPEVNAACFAAAVRAVFEAGARAQWIPVGERLPDHDEKVLAVYKRNYHSNKRTRNVLTFVRHAGGDWRFISPRDKTRIPYRITHWMPLPAAPLAGGKGEG